jgi:hypothetical protein
VLRPVWSWWWYSAESEFGSIGFDPFTHCPSILFIALPVGPGKRLTALSVNAAPHEGRQPASGAHPLGKVLHRRPGLSSPGVLLEGPLDAPRSLPSTRVFPVCFPGPQALLSMSIRCDGRWSGGSHPTAHRQMT